MNDLIGWDIGGAHVKACRTREGKVLEVAQWACPLWQGVSHLEVALQAARARWPMDAGTHHAVTMTGEMVDLFEHREAGVQGIASLLESGLPGALSFFAGDAGWCGPDRVAAHWEQIASANWLATARHAALELGGEGLLLDIGSTTTDIIAFKDGRILTEARTDVQRLASGELVYQGVVRTPLCALAPRIGWRGQQLNVMNEYFATVADVYRLTGELNPAHDLYPAADNAAKDLPATRKRLARMIGMDARDASDDAWLGFAREWRAAQLDELASQARRVIERHRLSSSRAILVSAGCGDFVAAEVAAAAGLGTPRAYGRDIAARGAAPEIADWAQVCAPSAAVALLRDRELR